MGCNCGKGGVTPMNYKVTFTDGTSKVFRSEIEAKAATVRKGGGAIQAVPR